MPEETAHGSVDRERRQWARVLLRPRPRAPRVGLHVRPGTRARRARALPEPARRVRGGDRADRRCLLVPQGGLGRRADTAREPARRPPAPPPAQARVPPAPRVGLGHRRSRTRSPTSSTTATSSPSKRRRARGHAASSGHAVAPARRVASARLHRASPGHATQSRGRQGVRDQGARRAAPDRGLLRAHRREAGAHALRRGHARLRVRPGGRRGNRHGLRARLLRRLRHRLVARSASSTRQPPPAPSARS